MTTQRKAPEVNLNTNEVILNLLGNYNELNADLINLIAASEEGLSEGCDTLEAYQAKVKTFITDLDLETSKHVRNTVMFRVVSGDFAHNAHRTLDDAQAEIDTRKNYNTGNKPHMSAENAKYWKDHAANWYIVIEKKTILKIT